MTHVRPLLVNWVERISFLSKLQLERLPPDEPLEGQRSTRRVGLSCGPPSCGSH